ncbi:MAG TPA: hypothetical protein PK861_06525 [Thermomonas sp.]|jgi:hypothetical protein|nr:hypothetical protein [Thermomonas sp.]
MTSGIHRKPPPRVRQTRLDSCWAATIEAWSRADSRIPLVTEGELIANYGEGATGGITPRDKIPPIAEFFDLFYGGYNGPDLKGYLLKHLPHSHVFCAYRRDLTNWHAVLIYRLSGHNPTDLTDVSYMDPDGGSYRWKTLEWFKQHGGLMVLMRK